MVKKTLFTFCMALTLAWAVPATAATILFDPDGAGGGAPIAINSFDMSPGNSIAVGGNALSQPGQTFQVYYQANLADAGSFDNGTGGNFFTVAAGFRERVLSNNLNIGDPVDPTDDFSQMAFNFAAGGNNFFQIYANTAPGDDLSGVCFICGTPIMQGHIVGFNSPSSFNAFVGQTPEDLDQFGSVDNYPLIDSLSGSGSFDIKIVVDSYNAAYFPAIQPGLSIGFVAADGTTTIPFDAVDPARCFIANAGSYPAGGCSGPFGSIDGATLTSLGPINGLGPNTMFETDANLTFQLVPEPASLALLGLGLLGTAAAVRRRTRQQARTQA